jgi:hypothetical protein
MVRYLAQRALRTAEITLAFVRKTACGEALPGKQQLLRAEATHLASPAQWRAE